MQTSCTLNDHCEVVIESVTKKERRLMLDEVEILKMLSINPDNYITIMSIRRDDSLCINLETKEGICFVIDIPIIFLDL